MRPSRPPLSYLLNSIRHMRAFADSDKILHRLRALFEIAEIPLTDRFPHQFRNRRLPAARAGVKGIPEVIVEIWLCPPHDVLYTSFWSSYISGALEQSGWSGLFSLPCRYSCRRKRRPSVLFRAGGETGCDRLLDATALHDATESDRDEYGQRYILDYECARDDLRALFVAAGSCVKAKTSPG